MRTQSRWLATFLYATAAILALVGLTDSIYLTVRHLTGQGVDCFAATGCEAVLTSRYAAMGKIPLAALGVAAYFTLFSLAILAAFGRSWTRPIFLTLIALMGITTCWLLYLQAFVLGAFCTYCLLSASLVALLTLIAIVVWRRA